MAMAPRPYWHPVNIKGSIGVRMYSCQPTKSGKLSFHERKSLGYDVHTKEN